MEVQILKANLVHIQAQIERVDQKLDKALEK
jgi:hypothetical protein